VLIHHSAPSGPDLGRWRSMEPASSPHPPTAAAGLRPLPTRLASPGTGLAHRPSRCRRCQVRVAVVLAGRAISAPFQARRLRFATVSHGHPRPSDLGASTAVRGSTNGRMGSARVAEASRRCWTGQRSPSRMMQRNPRWEVAVSTSFLHRVSLGRLGRSVPIHAGAEGGESGQAVGETGKTSPHRGFLALSHLMPALSVAAKAARAARLEARVVRRLFIAISQGVTHHSRVLGRDERKVLREWRPRRVRHRRSPRARSPVRFRAA
jgi:hypothetical protein